MLSVASLELFHIAAGAAISPSQYTPASNGSDDSNGSDTHDLLALAETVVTVDAPSSLSGEPRSSL